MADKTLLFPVRDLPPHLGGTSEGVIRWTVPEGWQTEVLTLPPGVSIDLAVELMTIDDGILVQVKAHSEESTLLRGECVRCLDPVTVPWWVEAADVYEEPARGAKKRKAPPVEDGFEAEGDELDQVLQVEHDHVNIEPLLRDAILASAPLRPLCSRDCQGLCDFCGARLSQVDADHYHEFLDPRFSALEGFFEPGSAQAGSDE